MKKLHKSLKYLLVAGLYSFFTCSSVYADDTEVFFAPKSSTDEIIPNVMFILDTSGSMNSRVSGSTQTRMQVLKDVMQDVLSKVTDVNVGLMRYHKGDTGGVNSAEGGPVLYPATYIDEVADPIVTTQVSTGDDDAVETNAFNNAGELVNTVTLDSLNLAIGNTSETYVGVRFNRLLVPQGAKITSASLVFQAKGDSSNSTVIDVVGQLTDNAPAFTTTPKDISSRKASATAAVTWTPGAWKNGDYEAVDISSIVQEIVNQSSWCGGNAMALILSGTALRNAYSFEGGVADSADPAPFYEAPKLRITYANELQTGANGCTQNLATARINHDDRDWERSPWGSWSRHGDHLDFYKNSGGQSSVGLSFENMNIPRSAKITDARIIFNRSRFPSGQTSDGKLDVSILVDGNYSKPNTNSEYKHIYDNRSATKVRWEYKGWANKSAEISPNLKDLVQSVVDRGDWSLGNRLIFVVENVSGQTSAYSHDNSVSNAPVLEVYYQGTYQPGVITKREELKQVVASLPASGYTPISDMMAEVGRYFRGEGVLYGIDRDNVATNRVSHIGSVEASATLSRDSTCTTDNYSASACASEHYSNSPKYVSPITDSCQSNHVIFITDGYPTSHHKETEDTYKAWSGSTCNGSINYGQECAVDMAVHLANNDVRDDLSGSQTVKTYMIGFALNAGFLDRMTTGGQKKAYTANNKDELIKAIETIVGDIVEVNTTFVTSGVSVNQLNRLTHNDQLYYSLFSPDSTNVWPGNVKRYKLSNGRIVDVNGKLAVDPTNATFYDTAQSYWTSTADGNDVSKGGFAEHLTTSRKVYTYLSDSDLTASTNRVSDANSMITTSMLGANDSYDREVILKWANGIDTDNLPSIQAHHIVGDPLHSQPTLITYNAGSSSTPSFVNKVLVGTNHGFLHQVDAETGSEDWAFIPKELLPLLSPLQKRNGATHEYGIDGSIALYLGDSNKNGAIDLADGEKAYLYVGQRRGGHSYYALDISNPSAPKFMFEINPSVAGYSKLGQTWSTPTVGRINIGGQTERLVLIFGGGYDTIQDNAGTSTITDSVGQAVYIADALTGELLWDSSVDALQAPAPAGSLSTMNSVPAPVSAFDLDGDGLLDHIYTSDTKAQVFRFDIDNDNEKITGGRIAHLGGSDVATNRRFYYAPDVALIRLVNESFISVSIGSGYRAHPLNEQIDDHFFMLKDSGVLDGQFDMDLALNDLADVTNLIGDSNNDGKSDATAQIELKGDHGWYIDFSNSGEKVIERSITFNNAVIFTTYLPPGNNSQACSAQAGSSRVYAMKIVDGNPYVDNKADKQLDEYDRYVQLDGAGIAPQPQVILEGSDNGVEPRLCVGTQCQLDDLLPEISDSIMGIRWRRN